jgi:hypothetical protein
VRRRLIGKTLERVSSPHGGQHDTSASEMKRKTSRRRRSSDLDTLRPEYDFSRAVRGATAARYRKGTNVVVIDPDVLDVFPDSASVNDALRALAVVLRQHPRPRPRRRSA